MLWHGQYDFFTVTSPQPSRCVDDHIFPFEASVSLPEVHSTIPAEPMKRLGMPGFYRGHKVGRSIIYVGNLCLNIIRQSTNRT